MKPPFLLLIVLTSYFLSSHSSSHAQTTIGFSGGLNFDRYEFNDPNNVIGPTALETGSWGITIGRQINPNLKLETGIIRKYYQEGFSVDFNSPVGGFGSNSYITWQIPLRVKTTFKLKGKWTLSPCIGGHWAINTEYGYGAGYGGAWVKTQDIEFNANFYTDESLSKHFFLLESGVHVEYQVASKFSLTFNVSNYQGFKKVSQIDYAYQINQGKTHLAYAHSNGSYLNYGFGLQYEVVKREKKRFHKTVTPHF